MNLIKEEKINISIYNNVCLPTKMEKEIADSAALEKETSHF